MRHFLLSSDNQPIENAPRLMAATFAGHILSGVRTVEAAETPALRTKLAKGLRRVAVPQDAAERTAFIAKWVQRHQRRLTLGLPASILVLALGNAAAAQDGMTDLAAVEGIADVELRADGSVRVTLDNGSTVVIPQESVTIGADGSIMVSASAMDSLTSITASAGAGAGVATLGGSFALAGLGLAAGGGSGGGSDSASGGGDGGTTPVASSGGRVIDGYIAGATVFRDLIANGVLDEGEPSVVTDALGNFSGLGGSGGVIIAFGGTDISTGKAFTGQLTAPGDATVVTPLTTLVQALVQQGGVTSAQAAQQVADAFGLGDFDINNVDPVGTSNLEALKAGAQVAAIISVAAAGAGEGGEAAASQAVAASLATAIADAEGGAVSLDTATVTAALQSAAGEGADVGAEAAALQAAVDAIAETDEVAEVEQIQTVVQGDLVEAITGEGAIPDAEEIGTLISAAVPLRPTIRLVKGTEINAEEAEGFLLELTGTGRDGTSINIQFGDVTITDAATVENGTWSYTLTQLPSDGQAALTVTATETTGETSVTSLPAVGQTFTIDTIAPAVPTVALAEDTGTVAGETSNGEVTVSGLEDGSTREYSLDGGDTWTGFTGDSFTLTEEADYSVIVRQIDALENSAESAPLEFKLDTTAPDAPTLEGYESGDIINAVAAAAGATVTGTVEPGATVTLSSGNASFTVTDDDADGSYSFTLSADQLPEDGTYSISATATDGAGNTSDAVTVAGITIDTTAPQAPVIAAVSVDDVIGLNEETVTITGTAEDLATVRVTFNGFVQDVTATDGVFSVDFAAPDEDGSYTITATATDAAGNPGPQGSRVVTVDLTPPEEPSDATALIGSAMTLAEMESALTAFAAEQEGLTIPEGMLRALAGDALIYRSGQYSFDFSGTVLEVEGNPEGVALNSTLGGSINFQLPLGDSVDQLAGATDPVAVFQFQQAGITGNTLNEVTLANLRFDSPSLRMEVETLDDLPSVEILNALVGPEASALLQVGTTVTNLQIWLSGVTTGTQDPLTGEFGGLTGSEISINFLRIGEVGLESFFDDPEGNILREISIESYQNGQEVGFASAKVDTLDVSFTPGDGYVPTELVAGINALIDLRTAIETALEEVNAGRLEVADLQAIADALDTDAIPFAPPFLAGEALSQAAVNRLVEFLAASPEDQAVVLAEANAAEDGFANLTELLVSNGDDTGGGDSGGETDTPTIVEFIQGEDGSDSSEILINGATVDLLAIVEAALAAPVQATIEILGVDDRPGIVLDDGRVVIKLFVDVADSQTGEDWLLILTPEGTVDSYYRGGFNEGEPGLLSFDDVYGDAQGIVFSVINASSTREGLVQQSEPYFTTYRLSLGDLQSLADTEGLTGGRFELYDLIDNSETLLMVNSQTIPFREENEFVLPTAVGIEVDPFGNPEVYVFVSVGTLDFGLPDNAFVANRTVFYNQTGETTELPGAITDITPVMNGDELSGVRIAMTLDLEPAGAGPTTQDTVFVYDIVAEDFTAVQTTGTSGDDDLVGFGSNDLIIPLGASAGELQLDVVLLPTGLASGAETIVIRLSDVEAGSKLAVEGFNPLEDEIAFLDPFLTVGAEFNVQSVTVEDMDNFTIPNEMITEGQLNLFAVGLESGLQSTLFATNGSEGGAVAQFQGVSNTALASEIVTIFNPDMLLETLPT